MKDKLTVLFRSTIEDGDIKNQVMGQVRSRTKGDWAIHKQFAKEGVVGGVLEVEQDGTTVRGVDPETGTAIAFTSVFKSSL